jgi:hypothetical protein
VNDDDLTSFDKVAYAKVLVNHSQIHLMCQAGLEITVELRLASNSRATCLSLLSTGIIRTCHSTWTSKVTRDTRSGSSLGKMASCSLPAPSLPTNTMGDSLAFSSDLILSCCEKGHTNYSMNLSRLSCSSTGV